MEIPLNDCCLVANVPPVRKQPAIPLYKMNNIILLTDNVRLKSEPRSRFDQPRYRKFGGILTTPIVIRWLEKAPGFAPAHKNF